MYKTCGEDIKRKDWKDGRTYCSSKCFPTSFVNWETVTHKQLKKIKGSAYANTRIRGFSKLAYDRSDRPKECYVCGYDQHYEVCHIDGISTYSDDVTIDEINDIDNLVAMCPTHHWELDYGKLTMFDIIE